jgi:hypothetical protein
VYRGGLPIPGSIDTQVNAPRIVKHERRQEVAAVELLAIDDDCIDLLGGIGRADVLAARLVSRTLKVTTMTSSLSGAHLHCTR